VVKMHRHVRDLERRSARRADLRAAIRQIAAMPERDARLGELGRALIASGHLRSDRRPATAAHPAAPPTPRSHSRAGAAPGARPLARKRGSLGQARELAARRQAALGAWLEALTGGVARVRLSALATADAEAPRRWLDVARASHLGGGRVLRQAGFAVEPADGEVVLGDDRQGLAAPDGWITRSDKRT